VFPVMPNLTRFNLSNNQLTSMPECVFTISGQSSFPHLKYFNLRGNQIATVPRDAYFCDLEVLNLSQNKITELPDKFLVSMPSLRILDASMNEICELCCSLQCKYPFHL
jgi:Leucine-rich repeat (LRR) protein